MSKIKVAVLFGGVSSEHEVSRRSCCLVLDHIDREKYEVYPIGITKQGDFFYYQGDSANMPGGEWEQEKSNRPVVFSLNGRKGFSVVNEDGTISSLEIDVVFPVLHGKNGEDGTLQGMLMLAGIPFVGRIHGHPLLQWIKYILILFWKMPGFQWQNGIMLKNRIWECSMKLKCVFPKNLATPCL